MPIRVVLVDDVTEIRQLVRIALRVRTGFEIAGEAGDGASAVSLVERVQPDVVVLDLGLPDLAGHEVLTRIRAGAPAAKVVVFTGLDAARSEAPAEIAGQVEGFVAKDAEIDYLVEVLESLGQPRERVAVLPLPRDVVSVGRARNFVRGALTTWGAGPLADDASLVVSELVTNAITHAESACELRLASTDAVVRIEVLDFGAGTPDLQVADAGSEHGRGLYLISALSSAWGVEVPADGPGKIVWVELQRAPAAR